MDEKTISKSDDESNLALTFFSSSSDSNEYFGGEMEYGEENISSGV